MPTISRLAWVTAVAGLLALGPGGGLATASAAATGPSSAVGTRAAAAGPSVPSPGSLSELTGVTCTAPQNCWAVGTYDIARGTVNEALRWNGDAWSLVATPDPGTDTRDTLYGVTCTAADNCWAVGTAATSTLTARNEALHWNGTTWSAVVIPDPGNVASDLYTLYSVSCPARNNCWAVGLRLDEATNAYRTVALHWTGAGWSAIRLPRTRGSLSSVACISTRNCWAAGSFKTAGLAFHWNGARWAQVTLPPGAGSGDIACPAAKDCWIVGSGALHWNGSRWSEVPLPRRPKLTNRFWTACPATNSCWTVEMYSSDEDTFNEAVHWNGMRWVNVSMPQPGPDGTLLDGVGCASSRYCFAVGWDFSINDVQRNEILHWNGTRWSVR
jgi:hypothetical protein